MKKIGVVQFPGSNCDRDVFNFAEAKGYKAEFLWHLDQFTESSFEAVILPGGFSYGDYLRAGALSARSPVMNSVRSFAAKGFPVLGICNGFQVLTESGLLAGALVKNSGQRFIDGWVQLRNEKKLPFWGKSLNLKEQSISLPIAHGEGRFFAPDEELKRIEDEDLVWFRYLKTPNGALNEIAGLTNRQGNVAGLMPHPERAFEAWMGGVYGWGFL